MEVNAVSKEEAPMLLNDNAASSLLGVSRATLWRGVEEGDFPKPVKIRGRTLWVRSELMSVINSAMEARNT